MLITLQRHGYVRHIVTTRLCFSHCDDRIFASHCLEMIFLSHCDGEAMFMTLQQHGYVHHNVTIRHVCHIATVGICSLNYNDMAMFNTM